MRWLALCTLGTLACGNDKAVTTDARDVDAHVIDAAPDAAIDAAVDAMIDAPAMVMLTVNRTGAGQGTVSGTLACGAACSTTTMAFPINTQINLSAVATNATSSRFGGWSGGCTGIARACSFMLTANTTVTAQFETQGANLVFVTSSQHAATLGSLGAYDTICNTRATEAGINNASNDAYRAYMSVTGTLAPSRFAGARGWIRMDGRVFADELSEITTASSQVFNPVLHDEQGGNRTRDFMLTGTTETGALATNLTCSDWTSTTGDAMSGYVGGGPGHWGSGVAPPCASTNHRLLCMGTTMSTSVAPTAVAGKKLWITAATYTVGAVTPDAHCNANKPGGVAATHAVLATSTTTAASELGAATVYVRPDGVEIGTGAQISAQGNVNAGYWQDSNGAYANYQFLHGSTMPSAVGTAVCGDWTLTTGSTKAGITSQAGLFGTWDYNNLSCGTANARLMCVED